MGRGKMPKLPTNAAPPTKNGSTHVPRGRKIPLVEVVCGSCEAFLYKTTLKEDTFRCGYCGNLNHFIYPNTFSISKVDK